MSKKQRHQMRANIDNPVTETATTEDAETVLVVGADVEPSIVPKPRVTSFVPRACSCCAALRAADTNYSRVTSTQGNIRYCKCSFCGNTWKEQGQ
jgi:hypothetical protein